MNRNYAGALELNCPHAQTPEFSSWSLRRIVTMNLHLTDAFSWLFMTDQTLSQPRNPLAA